MASTCKVKELARNQPNVQVQMQARGKHDKRAWIGKQATIHQHGWSNGDQMQECRTDISMQMRFGTNTEGRARVTKLRHTCKDVNMNECKSKSEPPWDKDSRSTAQVLGSRNLDEGPWTLDIHMQGSKHLGQRAMANVQTLACNCARHQAMRCDCEVGVSNTTMLFPIAPLPSQSWPRRSSFLKSPSPTHFIQLPTNPYPPPISCHPSCHCPSLAPRRSVHMYSM